MTTFEFDETKSQANFIKHGINFSDAQTLWNDPNLLEIPAKTEDEARYLLIRFNQRQILVRHYHLQ